MRGPALWFLAAGVLCALAGMVWGMVLAGSQDHLLAPAHAHLNLVGYASFAIFAFYYQIVPEAGQGRLARLHFAVALAGVLLLVPGIVQAISGGGEALAISGSILTVVSMLIFLVVVVTTRGRVPA